MMRTNMEGPCQKENGPSAGQQIDYSPKPLTLLSQVVFGLKLSAIGGIIFFLFWLFEK